MSNADSLRRAASHASVTKDVIVAPGALAAVPPLASRLFPGLPVAIVADANTFEAAGRALAGHLASTGVAAPAPVVLGGEQRLKPHAELATEIAARTAASGAVPIAVGSGVVNDLVKRGAAERGVPYLCVPTAASMDGYTASGAALLEDGFKRTLPCPPPIAVVADIDVITAAPPQMAAWGYGDLAGKLTAGADWRLADAAGEEPIDRVAWNMVQGPLAGWLADPAALRRGDAEAVRGLVEGLLISGLAMQAYGNSRPASGSDHQFSHLWEMDGLACDGQPLAHGVCVALGCLSSLALYQFLCRQDLSTIDPAALARRRPEWPALERATRAAFPAGTLAESAVAEMRAKHAAGERTEERLRAIRDAWPALRRSLAESLPRPAELKAKLAALGAPTHPSMVGIDRARHRRDHFRARMIRRRYTILDLLAELGLFERAVDEVFAPGGFWGTTAGEAAETTEREDAAR